MSRFGSIVVCFALMASLGLSACGGDTKTQKGPKDPAKFARAYYQYRVSKVCVATNSVADPIQPKSLDEIPANVPELVPLLGAQITALLRIKPPPGLERAHSLLLGGLQAQIGLLNQIKQTADAHQGRKKAVKLVERLNIMSTKTQQLAAQMGLQNCGT